MGSDGFGGAGGAPPGRGGGSAGPPRAAPAVAVAVEDGLTVYVWPDDPTTAVILRALGELGRRMARLEVEVAGDELGELRVELENERELTAELRVELDRVTAQGLADERLLTTDAERVGERAGAERYVLRETPAVERYVLREDAADRETVGAMLRYGRDLAGGKPVFWERAFDALERLDERARRADELERTLEELEDVRRELERWRNQWEGFRRAEGNP